MSDASPLRESVRCKRMLLWPEINSQNFLNLAVTQRGSRNQERAKNEYTQGRYGMVPPTSACHDCGLCMATSARCSSPQSLRMRGSHPLGCRFSSCVLPELACFVRRITAGLTPGCRMVQGLHAICAGEELPRSLPGFFSSRGKALHLVDTYDPPIPSSQVF